MSNRVQYRRDTKARWAEVNPVLMEGEVGLEIDTKNIKMGDGVHAWNELEYGIGIENITSELGDSENLAASQKLVTDKFNKLDNIVSKFKSLGFYSSSNIILGEPYIDNDTNIEVVDVTLNSLAGNGSFLDFFGEWSESASGINTVVSCPTHYGAVFACCKPGDKSSLMLAGIGYGISSIGKYSSSDFFANHEVWTMNLVAYFYQGNIVVDNTSYPNNSNIHYPLKGFVFDANYGHSGNLGNIWCIDPRKNNIKEVYGIIVDCGNNDNNTTLTAYKVKMDGSRAEEIKSINIYKRGIYTICFDEPITNNYLIGVRANVNIGYKLNNGDYGFFELSQNNLQEFKGATLNIALLEKNDAITERLSSIQNKSLGNLGFYSLIDVTIVDFDKNFKNITFNNLKNGLSYVDFGSGSYIDNANINIKSESIKVPNNYAIIGLATKRLNSTQSIAELICWGIGASENGVYKEYDSDKVLSKYKDYSINVLAYYQQGKLHLNSIANLQNKLEYLSSSIISLQPKYGFIDKGSIGNSGADSVSYWTSGISDSIVDNINVIGIAVEAASSGKIEVVKIYKDKSKPIEVLATKTVAKAGIYRVYFDNPISLKNDSTIGVNCTKDAGNSKYKYKLNNGDYGLYEYHITDSGEVRLFYNYSGATLNLALLLKRDVNVFESEETPVFSHINAPIIYNTYIDSKGSVPALERSYQAIIQLDHLLNGLTEEYNIRFNNNKDIIQTSAPVYVNSGDDFSTASYVVLDNKESKEYNSNIKVLFENNPVYEFTLTNRCVRASVSKNKKPLVLCIGDSITDGQQALLYEDGLKNRYSFHDICLEMFMKDKIDAGNSGYDIEMLGTKSRSRKFKYNNAEYTVKTYHEGYGGSTASAWLNGTVGGGVFKKDNSTLFSISAWVNKYRTLSDDGRRLYFGTNRETTGVAGDNWGYYEDGAKSNYKLGTLVTNVESYNVCVPTHIHINLGANATTSVEQWQQFINIIHSEYPNVIIGLSVFDTAGTYFPSLHRDYDDSFCFWNEYANNPNIGIDANISYHNKQFNTQVNLQNFYGKENEKVYVLPFFYCTPSVESAAYRRMSAPLDDLLGREPSKLMYGWGGIYHINPLAHSYCAYQFYSWLKWTLK